MSYKNYSNELNDNIPFNLKHVQDIVNINTTIYISRKEIKEDIKLLKMYLAYQCPYEKKHLICQYIDYLRNEKKRFPKKSLLQSIFRKFW